MVACENNVRDLPIEHAYAFQSHGANSLEGASTRSRLTPPAHARAAARQAGGHVVVENGRSSSLTPARWRPDSDAKRLRASDDRADATGAVWSERVRFDLAAALVLLPRAVWMVLAGLLIRRTRYLDSPF